MGSEQYLGKMINNLKATMELVKIASENFSTDLETVSQNTADNITAVNDASNALLALVAVNNADLMDKTAEVLRAVEVSGNFYTGISGTKAVTLGNQGTKIVALSGFTSVTLNTTTFRIFRFKFLATGATRLEVKWKWKTNPDTYIYEEVFVGSSTYDGGSLATQVNADQNTTTINTRTFDLTALSKGDIICFSLGCPNSGTREVEILEANLYHEDKKETGFIY
jgi:hypothetical protein